MPVDPFTQAHTAIWDALIAWAPWAALIEPGNRIDIEQNNAAARRATRRAPADFANCEIDQGSFTMRSGNSQAAKITQTFIVWLADEVTKNVIKLNKCKYETFRALKNAGNELGLPHLIDDWDVTNARDDYAKQQQQRRGGFGAMMQINVEMKITNTTLSQLE